MTLTKNSVRTKMRLLKSIKYYHPLQSAQIKFNKLENQRLSPTP